MKTAIEKELSALAQAAFISHSWHFKPLFPNILIRIFDFEETKSSSGLYIPQTAQAPNYRAIVVRVWEPKHYKDRYGNDRIIESEFQPGDLVTVPYYTGVPTGVENLDDANYRITKENVFRDNNGNYIRLGADQEKHLHIFYKCGMYSKHAGFADILQQILSAACSGTELSALDADKISAKILDEYDIVPKQLSSVTKLEGACGGNSTQKEQL